MGKGRDERGRDHGGEGLKWKIGDHGEGDEDGGTRSCSWGAHCK
jgi:hypothetical protein